MPPSLRYPLSGLKRWIGRGLSHYLSGRSAARSIAMATDPAQLMACLQPGDVLLVDGHSRVSVAIKYLTQSTWSHAALYVDAATDQLDGDGQPRCFVEADLRHGVRAVSVTEILRVRHHSLFVPRDFDVSPYFDVIKPTLAPDFDYHQLSWQDQLPAAAA